MTKSGMDELSLRRRVELLEEELRDLNHRMRQLEPRIEPVPVVEAVSLSHESTVDEATEHHALPPPLPVEHSLPTNVPLSSLLQEAKLPKPIFKAITAPEGKSQPGPVFAPVIEKGSITEIGIGQVWAVRIGVLLLFTGFVFLANYAWEHFISQLGAMPRLIMLVLLALGGVAAGEIMRRKPRMETFGEVIAAGGLAALYYCAFAAHHINRLRVIEHPSMGALLLTATGLGILGYGAWRKASVMCAIALLLSFYGTSIQPVVVTAMVSGLIVSVAGAWLCVRYQWKSLGVVGLLGAYAAFILWQGLLYKAPAFSLASWFLCSYWLLYNAVILHQKNPWNLKGSVVICSLNYGLLAVFLPLDWSIFAWDSASWMVYAVLAVVSLTIWLWLEKSRGRNLLAEAHLVQGMAYLTLAIVTKWSGHELFLILAIKGLVLLGWDRVSRRTSIECCGFLLLLISALFAYSASMQELSSSMWAFYAGLLFAGVSVARREVMFAHSPVILRRLARWALTVIGLIVLISGVFLPLPDSQGALWMIGTSLVLTTVARRLGERFPAPEFVILAQLSAVLAVVAMCITSQTLQEWVLLTGAFLAFAHACVHPQPIHCWISPKPLEYQGIILSVSAWLIVGTYFYVHNPFGVWSPFAAACLMIGVHALVGILKWEILSEITPLFSLAVMLLIVPLIHGATLPLYAVFVILLGYTAWLTLSEAITKMKAVPLVCGAAGLMGLLSQELHGSVILLLLTLALCFTRLLQSRLWFAVMTIWSLAAFLIYLGEPNDHWLTYGVPFLLYAALAYRAQVTGKFTRPWTKAIAVMATLTLSWKLSGWVGFAGDAHELTILWALLAAFCFALGFVIKEPIMRLIMSLLLLASIGNILVSVWQLGTLMRIASFLVTGLIFLLLGYIYNRYPEWFGKSDEASSKRRPDPASTTNDFTT